MLYLLLLITALHFDTTSCGLSSVNTAYLNIWTAFTLSRKDRDIYQDARGSFDAITDNLRAVLNTCQTYNHSAPCGTIMYHSDQDDVICTDVINGRFVTCDDDVTTVTWAVEQPAFGDHVIKFNITYFSLLPSVRNCGLESLAFVSKDKSSKYCGKILPWAEYHEGETVFINYKKRNGVFKKLPKDGPGIQSYFRITYEFVPEVMEVFTQWQPHELQPELEIMIKDNTALYHVLLTTKPGTSISYIMVIDNGEHTVNAYIGPSSSGVQIPSRENFFKNKRVIFEPEFAVVCSLFIAAENKPGQIKIVMRGMPIMEKINRKYITKRHLSSDSVTIDTTIVMKSGREAVFSNLYIVTTSPGRYLHGTLNTLTKAHASTPMHFRGHPRSRGGVIIYEPRTLLQGGDHLISEWTLPTWHRRNGKYELTHAPDEFTTSVNKVHILFYSYSHSSMHFEVTLKQTHCPGVYLKYRREDFFSMTVRGLDMTDLNKHRNLWSLDVIKLFHIYVSKKTPSRLLLMDYPVVITPRGQRNLMVEIPRELTCVTLHSFIPEEESLKLMIQINTRLASFITSTNTLVSAENRCQESRRALGVTTTELQSCGMSQYHIRRSSIRFETPEQFRSRSSFLLGGKNTEMIFFTDTDMEPIKLENSAYNSSYVIEHEQMPQSLIGASNFGIYSVLPRYLTEITLRLDGDKRVCDQIPVRVMLEYVIPVHRGDENHTTQWYQFNLSVSQPRVVYDNLLYHKRRISLQVLQLYSRHITSYPDCSLYLNFTIMEVQSLFYQDIKLITQFYSSPNAPALYVVYWTHSESSILSWNDASSLCNQTGSSLPLVTSEAEDALLSQLILGNIFSDGKYLYGPARRHHKLHIYLALPSKLSEGGKAFPHRFADHVSHKTSKYTNEEQLLNTSIYLTSNLSCITAVWETKQQLKWLPIPCDQKYVTPIVVCQRSRSSTGMSGTTGKETDVDIIYVNNYPQKYPWMADTCESSSQFKCADPISMSASRKVQIDPAFAESIVRPNCRGSTGLERFTEICTVVIYSEINKNSGDMDSSQIGYGERGFDLTTQFSVSYENGSLIQGRLKCPENSMVVNGECYSFYGCRIQRLANALTLTVLQNDTAGYRRSLQGQTYQEGNQSSCVKQTEPLPQIVECGPWQYACATGECISRSQLMNGRNECREGDDEIVHERKCNYRNQTEDYEYSSCDSCQKDNCTCTPLFYQCMKGGCITWYSVCNGLPDCPGGDDENYCAKSSISISELFNMVDKATNKGQIVKRYKCHLAVKVILPSQIGDSFPDCPVLLDLSTDLYNVSDVAPFVFLAEDEVGRLQSDVRSCPGGSFSCYYGNRPGPPCFSQDDACVYGKDRHGYLATCKNGGHLLSCASIECYGMYKCPASYCLPTSLLCDGTSDCLNGEDEADCDASILLGYTACPGMFRCNSGVCIHQRFVCDGKPDCPIMAEDEDTCNKPVCPHKCECSFSAIFCSGNIIDVHASTFRAITIRNSPEFRTLWTTDEAHSVDLSRNNLFVLGRDYISSTDGVAWLDLSLNRLWSMRSAVQYLPNIRVLNLSHNAFSSTDTFYLSTLITVDLSHNQLKYIESGTFDKLSKLEFLDLSHNEIQEVNFDLTLMFSLRQVNLYENDLKRANIERHHWSHFYNRCSKCLFKMDKTCACPRVNIDGFPVLQRGLSWIVGLYLIIGAILVLIWRLKHKMTLNIKPLAFRDFSCLLMGVNILMLDLGEGVIVCVIAAMVQYSIFMEYCIFGAIHVCTLYTLTLSGARARRWCIWAIRLVSAFGWVHITMISTLGPILYYSAHQALPDFGKSCSIILHPSNTLISILFLSYLLFMHALCVIVLLIFARKALHNVTTHVEMGQADDDSRSSSSSDDDYVRPGVSDDVSRDKPSAGESEAYKLIRRKIKAQHAFPQCCSLVLLAVTTASLAGSGLSDKPATMMSVFILNLPLLYSLTKSVIDMSSKTCCADDHVGDNKDKEEEDYTTTRMFDQTIVETGL